MSETSRPIGVRRIVAGLALAALQIIAPMLLAALINTIGVLLMGVSLFLTDPRHLKTSIRRGDGDRC